MLRRSVGQGQGDLEGRPHAPLAVHCDRAFVRLYQPFGNCQAKANSLVLLIERLCSIEALEYKGQIGVRDSRPIVGNRDANPVHAQANFDAHVASLWHVLLCVTDQVQENLLHALYV